MISVLHQEKNVLSYSSEMKTIFVTVVSALCLLYLYQNKFIEIMTIKTIGYLLLKTLLVNTLIKKIFQDF